MCKGESNRPMQVISPPTMQLFVWAFCLSAVASLPLQRGRLALRKPPQVELQQRWRRATLPEHLIDCVANPVLADLYGGMGSPYCLQRDGGLFVVGVGGLLEQTLTIGFLVSAYFFFKRSQGGIVDWDATEVSEEDLFDDEDDDDGFDELDASGKRQCPQCGGSGRFAWTGPATNACEMCAGAGTITMPTAGLRRTMARRALPPPPPQQQQQPFTD